MNCLFFDDEEEEEAGRFLLSKESTGGIGTVGVTKSFGRNEEEILTGLTAAPAAEGKTTRRLLFGFGMEESEEGISFCFIFEPRLD